jgi:GNAT superfamily N-acetyltransferase
VIRPLTADDVARAQEITHSALSVLDARMARPVQDLTDEIVMRSKARAELLHATDPERAFVAEVDGAAVGLAMAFVREGMWFLSALMVAPAFQSQHVGRDLLEAALATATDRAWILTTDDARAVRTYQRVGFELHPTFTAHGAVDRSRIPVVQGIREYVDDRDTLDNVTRTIRGAAMGPEVDYFLRQGNRILVVPGKGFVILRPVGATWLAATDEQTARSLLWAAIAESTASQLEIDWLSGDQQWAIDVCFSAGLSLRAGAPIALRGQQRMAPYIPCGAFG